VCFHYHRVLNYEIFHLSYLGRSRAQGRDPRTELGVIVINAKTLAVSIAGFARFGRRTALIRKSF